MRGLRGDRLDIAIEVVKSSGGIDKLDVYAGLGVPEVWFWINGAIEIFALRGENYERLTGSELLPDAPLELLTRLALRSDRDVAP